MYFATKKSKRMNKNKNESVKTANEMLNEMLSLKYIFYGVF